MPFARQQHIASFLRPNTATVARKSFGETSHPFKTRLTTSVRRRRIASRASVLNCFLVVVATAAAAAASVCIACSCASLYLCTAPHQCTGGGRTWPAFAICARRKDARERREVSNEANAVVHKQYSCLCTSPCDIRLRSRKRETRLFCILCFPTQSTTSATPRRPCRAFISYHAARWTRASTRGRVRQGSLRARDREPMRSINSPN